MQQMFIYKEKKKLILKKIFLLDLKQALGFSVLHSFKNKWQNRYGTVKRDDPHPV